MTTDLLNLMGDGKEYFDKIDFNELMVDIEIDKIFERSLQEDTLTVEEIMESAPWKQLEGESELQYDTFKYYINLNIDEWEAVNVLRFIDIDEANAVEWCDEFQWKERRLAYLKYQEWLRRKKSELKHTEDIEEFRDSQAELLKSAGSATLNLISKLALRIEDLDPNEIKATDIPKFVSAISSFLDMTADAQARFLSVNELLALYENDLDADVIRQHVLLSEQGKVNGK
ncbi:MAG TPA: hypothetical protein PKN22_08055 [Taishania sp.]|nr:hypothetical protein [Taishania sp.]